MSEYLIGADSDGEFAIVKLLEHGSPAIAFFKQLQYAEAYLELASVKPIIVLLNTRGTSRLKADGICLFDKGTGLKIAICSTKKQAKGIASLLNQAGSANYSLKPCSYG